MGKLLAITPDTFEEIVLNAEKPVLVDFWAEWCPPCRVLGPTLEKFAEKESRLTIVKADVEENDELADQYNVMNIPTMILFKEGKEVHRMVGKRSEYQLQQELASYL
jgi:thioredoxin 1